MKIRSLAAMGTVVGLLALALVAPSAALADDPPPEEKITQQGYVLALWKADTEGTEWPQSLVSSVKTTDTSLNALDSLATEPCTFYQVDLYADNETTAALIAGGVLLSPNSPPESWPKKYDGPLWKQWTTTCPPPGPTVVPVPEPTFDDPCGPLNTTWVYNGKAEGVVWTEGQVGNTYTLEATPAEGYAFPEGAVTVWKYKDIGLDCPAVPVAAQFDVEPAPPTCEAAGSFDTALFPIDREGYTLTVDRPFDGPGDYVITATAKPGFVIEGSISRTVTVLGAIGYQSENSEAPCFQTAPLPATLTPPVITDECGTENDGVTLPENTLGVTYRWQDEEDESNFNVVAIITPGYVVEVAPPGWVEIDTGAFLYEVNAEFSDEPCVPPSLAGTFVNPVCVDDAAYLVGQITVSDDVLGKLEGQEATVSLTDGTHTYTYPGTYPIGPGFNELWPGASVGPDGRGITWPGYITNADGTYTATDDPAYFGWTRGSNVQVHVQVNPELFIDVDYPPSSPGCLTAPPGTPPLAATGLDASALGPWGLGGAAAVLTGLAITFWSRYRRSMV